mmetsp:Transcript_2696/g.4184  ORF Transcript_2696/g.4184 Transcript_2696/m.4184 type:complete len:219 (-) Transcript_2696:421-1077(-)
MSHVLGCRGHAKNSFAGDQHGVQVGNRRCSDYVSAHACDVANMVGGKPGKHMTNRFQATGHIKRVVGLVFFLQLLNEAAKAIDGHSGSNLYTCHAATCRRPRIQRDRSTHLKLWHQGWVDKCAVLQRFKLHFNANFSVSHYKFRGRKFSFDGMKLGQSQRLVPARPVLVGESKRFSVIVCQKGRKNRLRERPRRHFFSQTLERLHCFLRCAVFKRRSQ